MRDWRDNTQIFKSLLELRVACPVCHPKETLLHPHPVAQAQGRARGQPPDHSSSAGQALWVEPQAKVLRGGGEVA